MSIDLIFNELSQEPCAENRELHFRIRIFLNIFKRVQQKKEEVKGIRFEQLFEQVVIGAEGFTLADFCNLPKNQLYKSLLLGLRRYPYIEDESSPEAAKFMEKEFYLDKNGEKIRCYGLPVAFLFSVPAIGFFSESFWEKVGFTLVQRHTTGEEIREEVLCLSLEKHTDSKEFAHWLENKGEIELLKTDVPPAQKKINLRADHGQDELRDFANKLVYSPYVETVINSLPFNSHQKELIRKVYPDGRIEIVLHKTDAGFGLVVQTTGRNLRETRAIAELLSLQYV